MKKIILASGSPRRMELLSLLGREFEVRVSHCQEVITQTDPELVTMELARQKAEAVVADMEEDEDYKDNPVVFPPEEAYAGQETYKYLGEEGDKRYNDEWIQVKVW